MRGDLKMILYRILSILLLPLFIIYICWRALRGKEDKSRLQERFGFASCKKPVTEIIWIHAVSVGETNSSLILVEELLKTFPKTSILFTTTTLTSAAILANKIKAYNGRVIHQFLPIDSYFIVKRFLKFWRPKKAIFVESEIWPNFICEAGQLEVSTVLVNARISKKSFSRWILARKVGLNIFDSFSLIFAQSEEDKNRLQELTSKKVLYCGNLKAQSAQLQFDECELQNLSKQINGRKFWLAASTHNGEEKIIFEAHCKLRQKFPNILTIIVPRHPQRAPEIKALAADLNIAQRSLKENITDRTEIYLADTLGELGLFYALSEFAFLGGSLVEVGGHNPFEPAQLKCAIISGEYVANNKKAFDELIAKQACVSIKNIDELIEVAIKFMQNNDMARSQADRALAAISNNGDVVRNIVKYLH